MFRYTGYLEIAFQQAWWQFLTGLTPTIIYVEDEGPKYLTVAVREKIPWKVNFNDVYNKEMDLYQQLERDLITTKQFVYLRYNSKIAHENKTLQLTSKDKYFLSVNKLFDMVSDQCTMRLETLDTSRSPFCYSKIFNSSVEIQVFE
jgi:hypothetical protein